MITIPATSLQHISPSGLLAISKNGGRYSNDTVMEATVLLEAIFGTSELFWNGREVTFIDPNFLD